MKILADDLHVLTGSYALDALPDPERAEFERHLQHCPSCDAEVRGLRETAARLAMAQALPPPPGMEQRVLAATYRTRQLPPLPADHRHRARVSRLFDRRRAPVARRMAAFAAAASVAAAVALGITQLATQHQLETTRASDAAISRVVTAPDARIETTRTTVGRKRHRRRLRRLAGSRRHRHRDPAVRAGLPGVGDERLRRPLGRADGRPQHRAGVRRGARRPDRDNRRARGRDVQADHHARRGPARLALALAAARRPRDAVHR